MWNQRQGTQSTKQALPQDILPLPLPQQKDIFIQTYETHNTLYTDQTGRFPHLSSQGNRYQMILYHVDSNSIWAEPTKNKTEGELILTCNRALQRMKACGIQPTRQVLDNEISAAYKMVITNSGMSYQLVPPDDQRRNIAGKAIHTWKDHFIAIISGTDSKFPLHLWCQLLPQMEHQLSLLRQSNAYPHMSSHTHLYGHHDYNAHPFVPLGMEALVHDKPHCRKTFVQHCTKGYVIGISYEHYRCWKVWTPSSRTTRISATVFFKHKCHNISHRKPVAPPHNQHKAHHNNKLQLTDLTRLKILTQSPPLPPQREQHTPNPSHRHDSSASDDESVSTPLLLLQSPPKSPRVTPPQTIPPHPRVSTPPTARHTTRSVAFTQSHRKPSYISCTTPKRHSHHNKLQFSQQWTLSHPKHRHRITPLVSAPH
eukprot:CCRYP_014564-RA/>CCRYP_014564-RA protein AED:0.42 eAED:0.42 QI:0/0/0/1/0/0/3/0/425